MLIQQAIKKINHLVSYKTRLSLFTVILTFAVAHGANAIPAQEPIFLTSSAKPHISLVMSVDNELFRKAYNDYSNLDGGTLTTNDTTYRNAFTYYGYFDPDWCYTYSANATTPGSSYFTPNVAATNHKCVAGSGNWSGNFLNWATMTRVDILRRVLYGGKRSVDSDTQTVLERAYLPKDIHAFVKVYSGTDMNELTPYAHDAATQPAISMCNVSSGSGTSDYPKMLVATGAWKQWSASESQQCQYGSGTRPAASLIETTVKVESCVSGKDADTSIRCKQYGSSALKKPFGILQTYGENGNIKFSLVTGSYRANTKGGVLRRVASLVAGNAVATNDEIDLSTGKFRTTVNGIIKNIDSFRIAGYSFSSNNYSDCNTHSITVDTVKGQATSTQRCSDWGNPLSEIYLEALRYINGSTAASTGFNVNDAAASSPFPGVPGLTQATWGTDPWPATEWCAQCFSIVLSTGANSFDGDNLSSVSNITGLANEAALNAVTDSIGTQEYSDFSTRSFFSGGTTNSQRYCKPTTLSGLSGFRGMCPEQPATEGSYQIAGLAYHARITDLRSNTTHPDKQNLNTYAIDLAESLPSFTVPIGGNKVEFLPACEARPGTGSWQTCSLVDVTVESLSYSGGNLVAGSYLFYWEDSLWGNDYDFDGAQRIQFCVGDHCDNPATTGVDEGIDSDKIKIINSIPYAVAGNHLHFSYNIVGVGASVEIDEIANQSAVPPATPTITAHDTTAFSGGVLTPWANRPGSQNFNTLITPPNAIPSTVTRTESVFTASSSNAAVLLKKPLYYVAKYGGFKDSDGNNQPNLQSEWDADNDSVPDNYFSVKNPAELEESLNAIFDSIMADLGTASAVATSSTRLQENTYMYQAQFDASDWSGALYAYEFDEDGMLEETPSLCTKTITGCTGVMPTSASGRDIYTYNGTQAVAFTWANLTATQKAALQITGETTDANAQARVNWLKGDATGEGTIFRSRGTGDERNILGDIVNSSPAYAGDTDFRYYKLPGAAGASYRTFLESKKAFVAANKATVFVGGNDGMVHAFNADTLQEKFAYIPNIAFSKLANLTLANYGQNGSSNPHQFVVDGPITVGDAYIDGEWRTIVVGTLGAGGKGIYALDITESTPEVLFELDASNYSQMGYVMGKPLIVPMRNDRFAVVFGNGDSSGSTSRLFVIDLADPTGSNSRVIDTAAGTGLSAPALLPNGLGQVEVAYAGDLSGNMWRFNLSGTTASSWTTAYKLFSAKDSDNNSQPITAAPTLGFNSAKGNVTMVYFGTGKYYDEGDNSTSATPRHSFYAIADVGATVARSSLLAKTMTTNTAADPATRTVSTANPSWTTQNGWVLDMDANGERVTTKPLLIQDKLIFPTLIPTSSPCDFGGRSWIMQVTAVGNKFTDSTILDGNVYNEFLVLGDLAFGYRPTPGEASILGTGSDASPIEVEATPNKGAVGRQSWRQIR